MFRFITLASLLAVASAVQPILDGRIVGGEDADIRDYPYQVSLQKYNKHMCGASIISAKYAVTAAHCTDGQDMNALTVVVGISKLNENGQRLKITHIHQHPGFSMSTLNQDISVLQLDGEISLNTNAQPIALASDGSEPAAGTNVIVSGWGRLSTGGSRPEQLQQVSVSIVNRKECRDAYGEQITEYMICAGVPEGGKDACQGDSGGPLVANGVLVGVVSWGYGCATPYYPGVYSNVGALRSFIKQHAGI